MLHSFPAGPSDGFNPYAGVVIGKNGVLYGTTTYGGTANAGTVFSLTPPASPGGAWTETVLHPFASGSDGTNPYAGLVIGKNGVLFGTTQYGGTGTCILGLGGCGTVFSLTPPTSPGSPWTETVLHNFTGLGFTVDGANPNGVVVGMGGVLYGTTSNGGSGATGTVFLLTPPASTGGSWVETVLSYFDASGFDGAYPNAGLVIGRDGVLYGTTLGTVPFTSGGTVFKLKP